MLKITFFTLTTSMILGQENFLKEEMVEYLKKNADTWEPLEIDENPLRELTYQ